MHKHQNNRDRHADDRHTQHCSEHFFSCFCRFAASNASEQHVRSIIIVIIALKYLDDPTGDFTVSHRHGSPC